MQNKTPKIAVIIPCFKVKRHILAVLKEIDHEVTRIYIIDDCCLEGSGNFVSEKCDDPRITVVKNEQNLGVGGATMAGYRQALADGMDILVKLDGDGQMDPSLIGQITLPIIEKHADYVKGNRFYNLENVRAMPTSRIIGNAGLSLISKLSSGYWDIFDPTNGFTAIDAGIARRLPFEKISNRYFFESDMLFRLNTFRAVVMDIPMEAHYGDEISNMRPASLISEFFFKHVRNFGKRIFYNYYLRDMSLASIELPLGLILTFFGIFFGAYHWIASAQTGMPTSAGTVMLSAMPIIIGLQLILAFLAYDISSVPRYPISGTKMQQKSTSATV